MGIVPIPLFSTAHVRLGSGTADSNEPNAVHEVSENGGMPPSHGRFRKIMTGWWARATPLKNMSSSVGMIIPDGKIKNGNQTTNQMRINFCAQFSELSRAPSLCQEGSHLFPRRSHPCHEDPFCPQSPQSQQSRGVSHRAGGRQNGLESFAFL